MKLILLALCAIFAGTTALVIVNAPVNPARLLGAEHCTWGPSYWCQNLTIAASCNTTSHCIQKVWPSKIVEEDHDSVCEICEKMIQQARDQLQSNQTQEDLKAVFHGSCKLIMIPVIIEECDKLVDEFIPELVETLASQMNPSVVCSVSGLCNSPRIDQLILEHEAMLKKTLGKAVISLENDQLEPSDCAKCYTVTTELEKKFRNTSREQFFHGLLGICRKIGSQSDACADIVVRNFPDFYTGLEDDFPLKSLCFLSGQCSNLFHKHDNTSAQVPDVEIRLLSSVGMVEIGDDLPCKLCEQLVRHLRDLLVANTTEIEFKRVLKGLCGQTKKFADQCNSIVDEYYSEIYEYLVHRLNSNAICVMGGMCPSPDAQDLKEPVMPLLRPETSKIVMSMLNDEREFKKKNFGEDGAGIRKQSLQETAEKMQLPVERLSDPVSLLNMPNTDAKGQEACAFCEYLLHELQEEVSDPKTEEKIKMFLGKVCSKLPNSVEGTCNEFIDVYGAAIVAILAQEFDPSVVCPMVHVCPSKEMIETFQKLDKEWMIKSDIKEKPSCPLCLFAVTQIYNVIKNNKTEANIVNELDKLCHHLPASMKQQCEDFVDDYSKELVEMLLSDLTPQEVCLYIKLCDESKEVAPPTLFPTNKYGEIISNEIPDNEVKSIKPVNHVSEGVECILCQYVVKYIEDAMKDANTREEVKKIVHEGCAYLPGDMRAKCTDFVNTYADKIIELFANQVHPKLICMLLEACPAENMKPVKESVAECALCQAIISAIDSVLISPSVDMKLEHIVQQACNYVSSNKYEKCLKMVEVYGHSIINLLKMNVNTRDICGKMALCSTSDIYALSTEHFRDRRANVDSTKRCTWGDEYVCGSQKTAIECNAKEYCSTHVWNGENSPPSSQAAAAIAAGPYRGV